MLFGLLSYCQGVTPHCHCETFVKPAKIVCVEEVFEDDAASTLSTNPLSIDAIARQDEIHYFSENKIVENLRWTKLSIQMDASTIHSKVIFLVYVNLINEDDTRVEVIFLITV